MTEHVGIICIYDNYDFFAPIEYTFNLILSTFGIPYKIMPLHHYETKQCNLDETVVISYGREYMDIGAKKQIHIYASYLFNSNYLKPASLPTTPFKKYNDIPVIYPGQCDFETWIRKSEGLIESNVDIIASSFFMVSRYEEVVSPVVDKYGGFPASASLAFKECFLNRPIVNEYIELMWEWITILGVQFVRKKLWDNKDFAVCMTHDIDEIDKYKVYPPLGTMKRLLVNRKAAATRAVFVKYLQVRASISDDPYHIALERIIKLEAEHGFTSSFYLMPEEKHYKLDNYYLQNTTSKLKNAGFEIGIHPEYKSSSNAKSLKAKKQNLEVAIGIPIIGGRIHSLQCKIPYTWRTWEAAELIYDTTLGFNDCEGFRCGICYPFRPFDLLANRVVNLWELPLTVMDITLVEHRKMSPQEASKTLYSLLDCVQMYGGVFVLLLHPSYFSELLTPEWSDCFQDFYNTIHVRHASVSSAYSIIHEWSERYKLIESH